MSAEIYMDMDWRRFIRDASHVMQNQAMYHMRCYEILEQPRWLWKPQGTYAL